MRPILLLPGVTVSSPGEFVKVLLAEAERQLVGMAFTDPVAGAEFIMAADALNLHRLIWRCTEEWGEAALGKPLIQQLKSEICRHRRYDPDEFESACHATRSRARLPFGWTALDLALFRAVRHPIRLLSLELANSTLAARFANVALQLQLIQLDKPILLPIEQLRQLFGVRKIVASGTVNRLVESGLLRCVDAKYHTGKAREFMFRGVKYEHYEEVELISQPEVVAV